MTETLQSSSTEEMIDEIRAIIDRGLGDTKSRQVIAASEVADLLLDLRLLDLRCRLLLRRGRRCCAGRRPL